MQRYAFILKLPNHFCISPLNDVLPTLRPLDRFVAVLLVVSRIFIIFAAGKGKITNNIKTMKRVLFILMLMTIGLSAQAQLLKVGGVTVNLNKNTIDARSGLDGGTYSYYYTAKKLVLNDAKIKNTNSTGISSTVDGLTILFNGENTIEAECGILLEGNTRMAINSNGKVTVTGSLYSLLIQNKSDGSLPNIVMARGTWSFNTNLLLAGKLTIEEGADVSFKNTFSGNATISKRNNNPAQLTIDNSTLTVNGSSDNVVSDVPVVLNNSVIASPLKAVLVKKDGSCLPEYSPSEPALLYNTNGTPLKGNLTIKPGTAYGLWICGVQLNSLNYNSIWQLEVNSVMNDVTYLYYTPSSKTLTMVNTIRLLSRYFKFPPIHNEIDGLLINTSGGTHYIGYSIDNGLNGIESYAKCSIYGGGSLSVSSENGDAIYVDNSDMIIDNITLNARGGGDGLEGQGNSKIYVSNSTLDISGGKEAIYVQNNGFDPNGNCYITTPTDGVKLNNSIYSYDFSTGQPIPIVATTVKARQLIRYPLWMNGTQITELNCDRIKSILNSNSAEGSITFSPPNKLLINNLKILPGGTLDDYFISTSLDELILNLTGTSFMRATGKSLFTTKNLTVTGTGSINVDTGDDNGIQVGGTFKITGSASFMGSGKLLGVSANKLVMTSGTELRANASSESGKSLACNTAPQLDGVALPADMYYYASKNCICYKATNLPVTRNEVVINAKNVNTVATSIEEPDAFETDAPTRVYTTTGQLVWQGTGQPQLPSGIYIVNGTKVVIK
jgi:hypothetical protein